MLNLQVTRVAAQVRETIAQYGATAELSALLTQIMTRPGRVLAQHGSAKWPAFVLEPCRVLKGDLSMAVCAAAAIEFAVAMADVVDDLVDDEWEQVDIEWRRMLNLGPALCALSHACLLNLAGVLPPERVQRINKILMKGLLTACGGEDLDLQLETLPCASEESAHAMTVQKAGSLVAMACTIGAAIGTDDPVILELIETFGTHVGVISQLLNDIAGIAKHNGQRGTDLQRRKKTLPIAYAVRCATEENFPALLAWSESRAPLSQEEEASLVTLIHDLGGLHYAWVVADVHRNTARATVDTLATTTGRVEVRDLQHLIPALRASRR